MSAPDRGFAEAEFRDRTRRAQERMQRHGLSALLLTTEPEVRYYTGFLTRFWESPTRPWFVVLPANGPPIAVIPAIGAHLMSQCWITDIRTWNAPDYRDDGISLLCDTILEVTEPHACIGLADGRESHARMPLESLETLRAGITDRKLVGDAGITAALRRTKSEAEITKISQAVQIAGRAFARVDEIASPGTPLSAVFRKFQMLCLDEGADWVPYLAGAAAQGGYSDVISPATDVPLAPGDVLMLDTGLVWDGYFCDFNRNFSIGAPSSSVEEAHARLIEATHAAFDIARPGRTFAELHEVMDAILGLGGESGRLGHGVGMELTEGPSILPQDTTVLEPGMVLTLEPYIRTREARIMVHEENVVIRDHGPEFLTTPAEPRIREI